MYSRLVIWCVFLLYVVVAQDCHMYGEVCADDTSCCGGCCIHGTCVDTYQDCHAVPNDDPCFDFDCPPGETCMSFQPRCAGCAPVRECRTGPHIHDDTSSSVFPDVRSTMLFHYSAAAAAGPAGWLCALSLVPLYVLLK